MNMKIINLIGISGGKDSTALGLWAKHESGYPEDTLRYTFCDTGNESPVTYDYVRMLSEKIHPIEWLKPDYDFYELAVKKGRFPSPRARFCTTELKMVPTQRWISARQAEGYTVISHSGVRAGESPARAKLTERESAEVSAFGAEVYRPFLQWTLDDVWAIHTRYGIEPNPLYGLGAQRVGCLPCIMSRKEEIRTIARLMPERLDMIREQEPRVGRRGISTFFARDKVPLRFRTKIISTPIKRVAQEKMSSRGRWVGLDTQEAQGWLELFYSDDFAALGRASVKEEQELLMRDMAVCSIDDVIRWAMSGDGVTEELGYDDIAEGVTCSSGMCE